MSDERASIALAALPGMRERREGTRRAHKRRALIFDGQISRQPALPLTPLGNG
jgi:hypothetical protein